MGLESGDFIDDLDLSNPVTATDPVTEGSNHLRLIKKILKQSFPNFDAAMTLTAAQLNNAAIKNATQSISALWTFSAGLTVSAGNITSDGNLIVNGVATMNAAANMNGLLTANAGTNMLHTTDGTILTVRRLGATNNPSFSIATIEASQEVNINISGSTVGSGLAIQIDAIDALTIDTSRIIRISNVLMLGVESAIFSTGERISAEGSVGSAFSCTVAATGAINLKNTGVDGFLIRMRDNNGTPRGNIGVRSSGANMFFDSGFGFEFNNDIDITNGGLSLDGEGRLRFGSPVSTTFIRESGAGGELEMFADGQVALLLTQPSTGGPSEFLGRLTVTSHLGVGGIADPDQANFNGTTLHIVSNTSLPGLIIESTHSFGTPGILLRGNGSNGSGYLRVMDESGVLRGRLDYTMVEDKWDMHTALGVALSVFDNGDVAITRGALTADGDITAFA